MRYFSFLPHKPIIQLSGRMQYKLRRNIGLRRLCGRLPASSTAWTTIAACPRICDMKTLNLISVLFASAAVALTFGCNKPEVEQNGMDALMHRASQPQSQPPASGDKVQAFLKVMVPHHEMAVEMAQMALERAKAPELIAMARAIITAQNAEIEQMKKIHQRLYSAELAPDMMAHDALGMSMAEAGMNMDMKGLELARDFDQVFIDMMVPHHQGAIRMARVLLANTKDEELTNLGNGIITAQSAEIGEMNALREKLYGEPSPAGGVPEEAPSK